VNPVVHAHREVGVEVTWADCGELEAQLDIFRYSDITATGIAAQKPSSSCFDICQPKTSLEQEVKVYECCESVVRQQLI
jgi:hypothetical protein